MVPAVLDTGCGMLDTGLMRCHLIRHAVTADTGRILSGRLTGIPLSLEGVGMARLAADHLVGIGAVAVYTSPLQRCRETGRIIAEAASLPLLTDRSFVEVDYGTWSGRRLRDLYRLKAWQRLMRHPARFRFPEGETLGEVRSRAVSGLESLAERHGDEGVIVVSHGDVIRSLVCHYLGMDGDLIHRLDVAPASISVIDLDAGGAVSVPVVNHRPGPAAP